MTTTTTDQPEDRQDSGQHSAPPSAHRSGRRHRWAALRRSARDAGMATTEYAIVTVAAAGFGGLLLLVLRSDEVRGMLVGLVRGALTP